MGFWPIQPETTRVPQEENTILGRFGICKSLISFSGGPATLTAGTSYIVCRFVGSAQSKSWERTSNSPCHSQQEDTVKQSQHFLEKRGELPEPSGSRSDRPPSSRPASRCRPPGRTDRVLLRTNLGAGHGGASGRFNRLDEVAIAYAFALWAVGLADKAEV